MTQSSSRAVSVPTAEDLQAMQAQLAVRGSASCWVSLLSLAHAADTVLDLLSGHSCVCARKADMLLRLRLTIPGRPGTAQEAGAPQAGQEQEVLQKLRRLTIEQRQAVYAQIPGANPPLSQSYLSGPGPALAAWLTSVPCCRPPRERVPAAAVEPAARGSVLLYQHSRLI